MSDKETRAHELALCVVSEVMRHDFELMKKPQKDSQKPEAAFLASVTADYNFYFDKFKDSIK
ncbi:MAG: hypothetical protein IJA32_06705 [Lachnospiraceae bacterium]|nr:hypothetical protein [Lachnospiraceae bacterium]